jgi:GMP synthase-like glutamine amidotransferase
MNASAIPPMRLTIIQHHPAEHCGELAAWAQARGVALDVYRADLGQLPKEAANLQPILLLGGPYPLDVVPNPLAWLRHEQAWLAQCLIYGTPVFGICLGAQLLCMVRGGTVRFMPEAETGWTQIKIENSAAIEALQWHEDECILPEDARIMGRSQHCAAQYFTFDDGRQIGLQFHPEWNAALVEELNTYFKAESPLPKGGEIADAAAHFAAIRIWFWALLDTWWAAAHGGNLEPKAKS